MWTHDNQAVLDPFEDVPLICIRERYVLIDAMTLKDI